MLIKRIVAFFLDFYIITILALMSILSFHVLQTVAVIVALLVMICRDIANLSIGRRIFKLSVVKEKEHSPLPFLRRIGRNLTYIIWPLEVIVAWKCNGRRLGDMWMKSEVIEKK